MWSITGWNSAPPQKTIAEWRAELGIGDNKVVAAMVANFRSEKDHSTLLHAWSRMLKDWPEAEPQPCLVLAGAPQFTFEEVQRLAGELGILDTLRFPGQVTDVSGLLAACDIGILVSCYEGLPNAVLEYMAAGIPVIATDLPGNREALGCDSGDIFCQPGDPDDLALRLERMVRGSGLRKQLGDRNLKRAGKKFSVNTMCEKTVGIINGLLENGSNTHRR